MTKLTIFGFLASIVLLAVPVPGIDVAAGLPGGVRVTVINPPSKPVPVSVSTEYRFVGYSSGTTSGNAGGTFGMNAICQASFGSSARLCTTREFVRSPVLAGAGAGSTGAWIRPEAVAVLYNSDTSEYVTYDVTSGAYEEFPFEPRSPDCYQWTSDNGSRRGLLVNTDTGSVQYGNCDVVRSCACCAP